MKRLIYISLLVISWNTLTAQTYQVNNQKIRFMNALGIPAKDTTAANWANAADTSIILIRPQDSTLWYKYKGSTFRKVGTGGTAAIVDTVNTISSKPWRQKGIDSLSAALPVRITDSLRALVRLRAQGSGGIDVQNSSGTSVASFGSGGTTNISLNGSTNVNARLNVTDSIVGVNQRLTGGLNVNGGLSVNSTSFLNATVRVGNADIRMSNAFNIAARNFANTLDIAMIGRNTSDRVVIDADGYGTNIGGGGTVLLNPTGGNVGVNTNSPSFSLDVNGAARISGALTARAQGNNITIGVDSSVTTTTYTLVLGDAGYLKRCSNASAITITVPTNASVAFPIGTTIYFSQQGAGKVSVSPATSDVTIQSEGNLLGTAGQHAVIGLIKVNTNRWLLVGNRG